MEAAGTEQRVEASAGEHVGKARSGWYADPSEPGKIRYWGGAGWTSHQLSAKEPRRPELVAVGGSTHLLAGWWRRVAAFVVDFFVLTVLAGALRVALGFSLVVGQQSARPDPAVFLAFGFVAALVYFPLVMWRTEGQTFGKRALGLRVIASSGEAARFGTAVVREVVGKQSAFGIAILAIFIPAISGLGLVDYLWPLWDPRNQSVHDKLAKTLVVRTVHQ